MNTLPSRRGFLKSAALLPFAATAGIPFTAAAAALAPIRRAGGANIKTSLNAYSFLELLNANLKDKTKGIDLFQLIDFCAECNFDAVDLTGYFFIGYPNAPEDKYLIDIKRHAFDRGVGISGTGIRNDFTAADKAIRREGVERIKTWIEVAAKIGAPTVRAFADSQPPFKDWRHASNDASREQVEEYLAADLRECAEHGAKYGVIVAVQNHGDFIATGEQHKGLIERVDNKWCAAMVDTGKYNTPDPYIDIAMMAPHAVNWQIKELMGTPADSPPIDMVRMVTIIRKSGYRGFVPIETLASGRRNYDSFVEVRRMLGELDEAIAATANINPDS
jgi:sugar phosphate isomerase/epimerase